MEIREGRWETPPWHCSLSEKRPGTLESPGSPLIELNSSTAVQHPTRRFSEGLDDGMMVMMMMEMVVVVMVMVVVMVVMVMVVMVGVGGASLIAQLVKNPPAMQETLVQSLGQEDPLEGNSQPQSDSTERLSLHFKLFYWND